MFIFQRYLTDELCFPEYHHQMLLEKAGNSSNACREMVLAFCNKVIYSVLDLRI